MFLLFIFSCLVLIEKAFGSDAMKNISDAQNQRDSSSDSEKNIHNLRQQGNPEQNPNIHTKPMQQLFENPCPQNPQPGISIVTQQNIQKDQCMFYNQSFNLLLVNDKEFEHILNLSSLDIFYCVDCQFCYNKIKQVECINKHRTLTNPPLLTPLGICRNQTNLSYGQYVKFYDFLKKVHIYQIIEVLYHFFNFHQILVLKYQVILQPGPFRNIQYFPVLNFIFQSHDKKTIEQSRLTNHRKSTENLQIDNYTSTHNFNKGFCESVSSYGPEVGSIDPNDTQKTSSNVSLDQIHCQCGDSELENSYIINISRGETPDNPANPKQEAQKEKTNNNIKSSKQLVFAMSQKRREAAQDRKNTSIDEELLVQIINMDSIENLKLTFCRISQHFFRGLYCTSGYRTLSLSTIQNKNLTSEKTVFGDGNVNIYEIEFGEKYIFVKKNLESPIFLTFDAEKEFTQEFIESMFNFKTEEKGIVKHIFTLDCVYIQDPQFFIDISHRIIFLLWNHLFIPHIKFLCSKNTNYNDSLHVNMETIFGYYAPNESFEGNNLNKKARNLELKTQSLSKSFICKTEEIYFSILDTLELTFEIPNSRKEDKKYENLEKYFFFTHNDHASNNNDIIFHIFSKKSCLLGLNLSKDNCPRFAVHSCYIEFICTFNSMNRMMPY